jgi:[glutamine synthetase] adenylyltransferase / [glutamine synthetase]-adenylyl-L-tyrosine phosphorylase
MFPYSPFLTRLATDHADWIASHSAETGLTSLIAQCADAAKADEATAKHLLRDSRNKAALLIAKAEIDNLWTTEQSCRALTEFADAATQAATCAALLWFHEQGRLALPDPENPQTNCGYVILAMGKHGAGELNYSSDIDLIVLYDAQTQIIPPDKDAGTVFVRLTQKIVSLLQDITEDGYVFRTDLRLRPDPRATQVAICIEAAAIYYENLGQNWERAAMIKARAVAGDIPLGEEFLTRLQSYIWRKYLDFAAVADIQSLKRQIHAHKGHGEIAIKGHNLKLGRGGIREIELFVQTQQLIAGGKNPTLRGRRTVDMLAELAKAGWISAETATDLTRAYWTLRKFEHRVQMINDQQDHCVPVQELAFENYARFCDFKSGEEFSQALRATLETVVRHSESLFRQSETLGGEEGSLVFTGGEDDPDTIATMSGLGFTTASEVSATIRGWHFGRYNATRSKKSRELLTELMPALLKALAATGDADHAFIAFDKFLSGLPAGVQLFSMLKANPQLLELLCRTMGTAPKLAQQLSRQPRTLEAVLDRKFFGTLPAKSELRDDLASLLEGRNVFEDIIDQLRIFVREQMFRVGVRILSETLTAAEAGQAYANIADIAIQALHRAVIADIEKSHGTFESGNSAIVALGKWGGGEMTATSDLDLMLIYVTGEGLSSGPRPLSPGQYYAKLTQRLVTAITSPTAEGVLYEADMRLRPSGNKGPVAVSLAAFESYQRDEAWTWEKMALTRARVISAAPAFGETVNSAIKYALAPIPPPHAGEVARSAGEGRSKILEDIRSMRALMLKEHKPSNRWDLKRKRGGLVEIEFIVQALQLTSPIPPPHAGDVARRAGEGQPSIFRTNTAQAIATLQSTGMMSPADATILLNAWTLYTRLTQILRLAIDGDATPETAPKGLTQLLLNATSMPDTKTAEALLDEVAREVQKIFDQVIGKPES